MKSLNNIQRSESFRNLIERKEANQGDQMRQEPARRKARRPAATVMDYDQMIIPSHTYQSWLRNSSGIVSKRGRKRKKNKTENLCLHTGRTSVPQLPEASSSTPPERMHFMEPPGHLTEGIHSGIGSTPTSIEKLVSPEKVRNNLMQHEANGLIATKANSMTTPAVPRNLCLDTVAEEWHHSDPKLKLARRSENGFTLDNELLVETGQAQTQQHEIINQSLDKITDSNRKQLKTHFDTPGSAKVESLNHLALGMNK
ncbi:unnamed protein product [Fraxinus pennsylvanica]|uniref:Uncharacterized protein n=1 Tax=Fraxinus pennsylvanica TaxID=56036 RepID=A0AAD2DME6_9LAMI|nr:unnamed protein product [Fraxinus pennsylvanica]